MELYKLKNEQDLKNVWVEYRDCYITKEYPKEYPCCIVVFRHEKDNAWKDMFYSQFVYKSDLNDF